jgi:zinc/manganese transport system permease protein
MAVPLAALAVALLALAPLGTQVLQRGVVFMDLAVAQAGAAAAMAALALGNHPPAVVVQAAAITGALAAAGTVAALSRQRSGEREALVGMVYVVSAAIALLVARLDAHGAQHLHSLLAGDVLWAGWPEVAVLAACAAGVALIGGARLARDGWFYPAFAVVCGVAVQVLGLFVVFAALMAPALWHRAGLGRAASLAVAGAAAAAGLAASWFWDAPSGALVALALGLVGAASAFRRAG